MAVTEIAGIIVPAVVTDDLVAKPVVDLLIEKYKAGKDSLSLADMHEVLNYGLERLLALRRDKEHEVLSHIEQKDPTVVYTIWKKHVSDIEKEATSLNTKYEEVKEKKRKLHRGKRRLTKKIKMAQSEVIKLLGAKCPKEILVDLPSIEEYPTLQKAFRAIQTWLQSDQVKYVALDGRTRVGKTTIMKHLNNHFCGSVDFDVVIFIELAADDEQTHLHILQKIAEKIRVDIEGHEFEVAERIQSMLENKRYLLILDGLRNRIDEIWEMLDISKDKKDCKVVITEWHADDDDDHIFKRWDDDDDHIFGRWRWDDDDDHIFGRRHHFTSGWRSCVDESVLLRRLSRAEAWKMFRHIVGHNHLPPTAKPASPLEGESSSKSSTNAIGKPNLVQDVLRLMRIQDFVHLMLSYPMRIGYEKEFLKQWINELRFADDRDIDSFWGRIERLLYDESPLRYIQAVIPQDITTGLIKGGSVSRETALKHVPKPILLLATHLALHQLTLTLTSDTIYYSGLALEKIQTIWFSTRNDAEKRTVVEDVEANSQIRAAFDGLEIIDLNQIDDETKREQVLLNLETRLELNTNNRRSRHLVLVVDGDGDKKADPIRLSLPMHNSKDVVVFITTLSSNDYLTSKVDLTIKTEDHLLPWELFRNIVGNELLHSSIAIQEIAVQIVEKCGGHLLAIILMAKSLKHEADVQLWQLALQKLLYRDLMVIANALIFNIIWANEMSEREKARPIRCLMVFNFQDYWKMSNGQLFARWFSQKLVGSKKEAKNMLQNFMKCSILLQFEDTQGRHILLLEDIKLILHLIREDIPENLSEGALVSTIPTLQVLNLSYTQMKYLCNKTTTQPVSIDLSGWQVETLPRAICKLQALKILWLEGCSQLRELPPQIAELKNLEALRLEGCERLETLPQEIWELHNLETLSLEHCSQLLELSPRIAKLENLKELSLKGCERLETLPQEIWELHKLETLSLEQCSQLLELSPSPRIAELENLKDLRLAGCTRLKALPQEIWELPNLKAHSLAGTSIFPSRENQELINSDDLPHSSSIYHEHSGPGKKTIPSSSSTIIPNGFTLKLKAHRRFKQFENFCQYIMQFQIPNLKKCDLSGTHIADLPPSLDFPNLRSLSLGNNLNLMEIPSLFFDHVPLISILDLSRTSIHELPTSIFKLQKLKELYLKECELFVELPPELGQLTNLTTLDLDGTLITHLPEEIKELKKLESLSLSFCNDSDHDSRFDVIPYGVLTQFTYLKVLRIDVNSDNVWWLKNFDYVLAQISTLKMLQLLHVYIPRVNFRASIEKSLSNFRFIIGHHRPRMISRVPLAIEVKFRESGRSLKFVNGNEDFPDKVKTILSKARAFFLDRHMTIKNLTEFGLENLKQLRLCILAECNDMQSIVEVDEQSFCMQFLTIFYMKNLRNIINRPILGSPVFSELKLLALHTCPELTTIFTMDFLHSLINLEELIVEDCPKVRSIISCPSSEPTTSFFLPRLRKLSLLFVPELASISNGVRIARNLEQIGLYYCPKLRSLSTSELSSEKLKVIRAETKWWEKLQWSKVEWGQEDPPHKFSEIFSPFDEDLDILTQLTPYELMTSFNTENDSE